MLCNYDLIKDAGRRKVMNGRFTSPNIARLRGSDDPWDYDKVPGLAVSGGAMWKQQSALTASIFKRLGLGGTDTEVHTMRDVRWLLSSLKAQKGRPLKVKPMLSLVSVKASWKLCTGEDLRPDHPRFQTLLQLFDDVYMEKGKLYNRFLELHPRLANVLHWLHCWDGHQRCLMALYTLMEDIVASATSEGNESFASIYLEKVEKADKNVQTVLSNVLMDIFLGGNATTSLTISWALMFMAMHPDIQDKVHQELDSAFGKGEAPMARDRHLTPYTEAVIHEVQRGASVADKAVPHRATKDCYLSTGHFIPKDTMVIFWLGSVMKDPKVFRNPETFDPTRFLDDTGTFSPHPKVIAFGSGKRLCPGKNLAMAHLYMIFAGILTNFQIGMENGGDCIDPTPIDGAIFSPRDYKLRQFERMP